MSTAIKVAAAAAVALWLAHGTGAGAGRPHEAAVAYARAQLGRPYAWGGTGPDSFDCSGLAMEAEEAAGIRIPRTSQEQWAELPHVSSPRPGDLVFFAGGDGSMSSPGHVGVVAGPGLMIDSPQPGGVVREESYRWPDLVGFADPGGH